MNTYPGTSSLNVITIAGQYGSGSAEIAAQLALQLEWRLIDTDIPSLVAAEAELFEEDVVSFDEYTYGFAEHFFLSMAAASAMEHWPGTVLPPMELRRQEKLYHQTWEQMGMRLAHEGNVVIVGRGSQALLASQPNVAHLRVVAPFEQRVRYVMQQKQVDKARASSWLRHKDQKVSTYHKARHGCDVNDPLLYDLVLHAGQWSLPDQIDLIGRVLEHKAARKTMTAPLLSAQHPLLLASYTENLHITEPLLSTSYQQGNVTTSNIA